MMKRGLIFSFLFLLGIVACRKQSDPASVTNSVQGLFLVSGECYEFYVPSTYDTSIITNDTIQVVKVDDATIRVEGVTLSYLDAVQNGGSTSYRFSYSSFPNYSYTASFILPDSISISKNFNSTPHSYVCGKTGRRIQ